MRSLTSLGLSTTQALELLTHPAIGEAQSSSDVLDGIVDASDRLEGGGVIQWLNDFDADQRYATRLYHAHALCSSPPLLVPSSPGICGGRGR